MFNGNEIKRLRLLLGLSQEQLSDELGIPKGRINQWEQRNSVPKSDDMKTIENFFTKNIDRKHYSNAQSISIVEDSEAYYNRFGNAFEPLNDGTYLMQVPIIAEYARGGRMAGFSDKEYFDELPKHSVVVDSIHKGKYLSFKVAGESMDYDGRDAIQGCALKTLYSYAKSISKAI